MSRASRCIVGSIVAGGILLATAVAGVAETFTLTLKRREAKPAAMDATSYAYWTVRPQYIYRQMVADEKGQWQAAGADSQAEAFKRIVTKEPKYQSAHPFRGVVKFGSQEYAFALDAALPKAKESEAKKTAAGSKESAGKAEGEVTVELVANDEAASTADETAKAKANAEKAKKQVAAAAKDFSYNRLYFDANHNGDLTDDKVIEMPDTKRSAAMLNASMTYVRYEFPRTDLTIDVDGAKVDYSFLMDGYAYASERSCTVMVSVSSAVCREGDITLAGKPHHVVVLDFNSNGRFDDVSKISADIHMASGQLYAEPGDVLLIDPPAHPAGFGFDSPYDANSSDYRCPLAEIVQIDGKWYDLKLSPAGDKLTLNPSTVAFGSVTNRNETFRALLYSEGKGFLKICGSKGAPITLPEGEWKLFSYTITRAHRAAKPAAGPAEKTANAKAADKTAKPKKGSLLAALGQFGRPTVPSYVSATATDKYVAVTVRKGQTVELPFGPPYKPTVTAMSYGVPNATAAQLSLEMSLVGAGGETCTNLMVNGGRPGKPEFTITDPDGKVVQQGSFEYG